MGLAWMKGSILTETEGPCPGSQHPIRPISHRLPWIDIARLAGPVSIDLSLVTITTVVGLLLNTPTLVSHTNPGPCPSDPLPRLRWRHIPRRRARCLPLRAPILTRTTQVQYRRMDLLFHNLANPWRVQPPPIHL